MGILFILLAISMGCATFIENDYGSEVARNLVYNSKWFELIFLLLSINLIGRIFIEKLYKRKKLTIFLFHMAFLVMLTGAFITRYFGYEGYLHIREDEEQDICITAGNQMGSMTAGNVNSLKVKTVVLPFKIKLNDFIIERYPGSESPSGYRSDVVLIDGKNNVEKPYSVYMNNILKYRGYRFYQSSYDEDERGTILSVNYDFAGILVTYSGYGLLFIFIILSMLNNNSVFNTINSKQWESPLRKTAIILFFLLALQSTVNAQKLVTDKKIADEFGRILVQDQKGRTKPLYTLSSDFLRKVTGKNEFESLSPMQVFLGMYLDFDNWKDFPLIKISNNDLRKTLGITGSYAAFSDIVDVNSTKSYKIGELVERAYAKASGERSPLDKEIMKVDERLNICYMINRGDFMKVFPLKDSTGSWASSEGALSGATGRDDSLYLSNIIPMFAGAVRENNYDAATEIISSIINYQSRFANYELPSEIRKTVEILYYKLRVFEKLFPYYAIIGLIMLTGMIIMVINGKKETSLFVKILTLLLFTGFLFHSIALGMRWYIAGHSPMSNGYESMIFISWVTLLAGFIFRRRSSFALSATAILASMTLMVAHLSFMDPEITNLVPVLKSYWLTLHVSVITGSYGFLGLGAVMGLITMILLTLSNEKNKERIGITIDELTVINYKTLTLGLNFLTIGTFLGAVWANESWGRYWGWDPKETWSLITIIIYSFVIHSRKIPGMKDVFTFNSLSIFAFSTVLMTYFGVNYYLSGLHSYASGDSATVPIFVYFALISLILILVIAYKRYIFWK